MARLTADDNEFIQAKMCARWGFERWHHTVRERSIDEMKDADEPVGHILSLEGVSHVRHAERCRWWDYERLAD